jgi:cytidylate kinase
MNLSERAAAVLPGFILTIDGPAGSGKSTTAERLSVKLGLMYLDTGAMYRAVTLAALERGIDSENGDAVSALASNLHLEMRMVGNKPSLFLDGRNIDAEIRTPEVSRFVSPVSRYDGVRRQMVRLQRRMGSRGGIVAEGRDTGTVVFPHANLRVFLVADIQARVKRRLEQLKSIGIEQDETEVRENIRSRDEMDSNRVRSPLLKAAGALVVDTSHTTIDEQVAIIEAEVIREAERIGAVAVLGEERNSFTLMNSYYRISHLLVRWLFRIIFGLSVSGSEHLRYRENYVFASNHCSYADPLVVGCALDREIWFLAKKELFRNRAFAWLIRTYHAIPVDREEIERSTMKRILALLDEGRSILMFPEGTRSRTGEVMDLKLGLGFTAVKSGVGIVPVYVSGTSCLIDCILRRRRLSVRIGPPIRIGGHCGARDRKNEYRVLTDMVRSAIEMLKDETEV